MSKILTVRSGIRARKIFGEPRFVVRPMKTTEKNRTKLRRHEKSPNKESPKSPNEKSPKLKNMP